MAPALAARAKDASGPVPAWRFPGPCPARAFPGIPYLLTSFWTRVRRVDRGPRGRHAGLPAPDASPPQAGAAAASVRTELGGPVRLHPHLAGRGRRHSGAPAGRELRPRRARGAAD